MRFPYLIAAAIACFISPNVVYASGSDYTDAALRQLKEATTNQKNGQYLLNLSSLRSLNDIALRPFFSQFTQHEDWTVQVHAVLGLAELSEDKVVDPWLVQQIAPTAREYLIAQALDDGLIQQEQIESLIKWNQLEATPRLLLLAELYGLGADVDKVMVKELANSTDLTVSSFASLLTNDEEIIKTTTNSLKRATANDRDNALQRTLKLIRQYKFKDATPWLVSLLDSSSTVLNDTQRYWTLFTLLSVNSEIGLEIWNRAFSFEPNRKDQVRYFLLILEAGILPTEEMRDRLIIDIDDPLLGNMFKSGKVNGEVESISTETLNALSTLVTHGHRASSDWVFRVVKDVLTDEQVTTFYKTLSIVPDDANARRKNAAIRSFVELIQISPEHAWEILRNAKDDSQQQELLLHAMLQIANMEAVQEAAKLRRIGVNRADVLALLLIARSATPLDKKDQECLGIIAAGGGHVSTPLETQAAWLYLKRMGLADKALAAVSAP
jgi:hypothetical protein